MSVSKDSKLSEFACDADSRLNPSSSLCRFATAHGRKVWSLQRDWQVSLDEDVEILSSCANGSIVAAITVTGAVTMLRGSDGLALGCRRLAAPLAAIFWVPSDDSDSCTTHALLLVTTTTDAASVEPVCVVTLVRNLSLQSTEPPLVSTVTVPDQQCSSITGVFSSDGFVIRLLGCSAEDRFFALDWDYSTNQTTPVSLNVQRFVNGQPGLHLDRIQNQHYYLFNAYTETLSSIDWLDASSLECSCRFELRKASKVTAIETLKSDRPDSALIAVAVQESPSKQRSLSVRSSAEPSRVILVLQVLVEETMGLVVLSKPHVLYSIPLASCINVELAASPSFPFWFHFKVWTDPEKHPPVEYLRFAPSPQHCHRLADIKRHLELGQLDGAERLLEDWEFADEYACFSRCEVPLRRLQNLLRHDGSGFCNPLMEQMKSCWKLLVDEASRAVRDDDRKAGEALRYVLQAVDVCDESMHEARLNDLEHFISFVRPSIDSLLTASEGLKDDILQRLSWKRDELQGRLSVIQFLAFITEQEETNRSVVLDGPLRLSKSISRLYETLVQERYYAVAELLWQKSKPIGSHLTVDTLVLPILKISPDVPPQKYCCLLERIVIPTLTINHESLRAIRSWACRTADEMDDTQSDSNGLDNAISLLEVIERSSVGLQLRVHESFATSSPFVERSENRDSSSSINFGFSSVGSKSFRSPVQSISPMLPNSSMGRPTVRSYLGDTPKTTPPVPTILSLGSMHRGAMKVRQGGPVLAASADPYEANDSCVAEKLADARCLRDARLAGLQSHALKLRNVATSGGAPFVAKKLIGIAASKDALDAKAFLRDSVEPFCVSFSVKKDAAILEYVQSRCKEKVEPSLSGKALSESAAVARCCSSDLTKGKCTLSILRASLFYGYVADWLETLTREAVAWTSSDSGLQSEIEEASRLLLIDGIIIKYCGREAREMFRVDCPRHAVRLLQFVTQRYNKKSVLRDALALCNAFSHLNSRDAGCWIMQHAMHGADAGLCASIMSDLYSISSSLAERVFVGILTYAEELLLESTKRIQTLSTMAELCREKAVSTCECAIAMTTVLLGHPLSEEAVSQLNWLQGCVTVEGIRDSYLRIKRLQTDFGVFASLSELRSSHFLLRAACLLVQGLIRKEGQYEVGFVASKIATAKKACLLLFPESCSENMEDYWVSAAAEAAISMIDEFQTAQILDFIKFIGLFHGDAPERRTRALLSIARSLSSHSSGSQDSACRKEASNRIVAAASILRDRATCVANWKDLATAVSLGSMVETAFEILSRCDEGLGEEVEARREELRQLVSLHSRAPRPISSHQMDLLVPLRRPAFHPSWFVGDGLLLPPSLSLTYSVDFCRKLWDHPIASKRVMDFLSHNGAHVLSLRVMSCAFAQLANSEASGKLLDDLHSAFTDGMTSLAERCLGGSSQIGLTSGTVDSQLATSFLLSLSPKTAFKMYLASIPSSLKARDFNRVQILAMVGVMATATATDVASELGFVKVGWKEQKMFHEQCLGLAVQASWWAKLRHHGVHFETRAFDFLGSDGAAAHGSRPQSSTTVSRYAVSLLPSIVKCLSRSFDFYATLEWSNKYAEAFDLPKGVATETVIEWCLAPENTSITLNEIEKFVRSALRSMEPLQSRSALLRRCLIALESSPFGGDDYERIAMVLAMYHETLVTVVESYEESTLAINMKAFEDELDLIDRRRDVISILISFFDGTRRHLRPSFPAFFLPLKSNTVEASENQATCGILGRFDPNDSSFDPLEPLTSLFERAVEQSIVTALSPMCLSLGLQQGYLHARFLMTRFKCSAGKSSSGLPSYENDVFPTLSRIRSASDRAVFAEWCAKQYRECDEDRLQCLDGALQAAIQASSEVEQSECKDALSEANALATVKRLTSEKEALSDTLRVKRILQAGMPSNSTISNVLDGLAIALDDFVAHNELPQPETMIDFLLSKCSLLAANASLDPENPLPTSQLRQICSVALRACGTITEHHSHINFRRRCKQHIRKWLFHGDSNVLTDGDQLCDDLASNQQHHTTVFDDEVTTNFKMDLNGLDDDDLGSLVVPVPVGVEAERLTSEEERSPLCGTSLREESEAAAHRSAIRIAFVLALSIEDEDNGNSSNTENSNATINRSHPSSSKKTGRLTSKLEMRKGTWTESKAFDHGRELLGIVFAKSSSELLFPSNKKNSSVDKIDDSFWSANQASATLNFAMRHRAMCAAAILCPQEVLERVLSEELFAYEASPASPSALLRQCTFGLFVAKEIEEMGLPLPHSNIWQLSSMHFPSYARALWRDHRDDGRPESRGRLLLLLVEMSLRCDSVDAPFVASLLEEMAQRHLTRSLHLACERILKYESAHAGELPLRLRQALDKVIAIVWNSIVSEVRLKAGTLAAEFKDSKAMRVTLARFGSMVSSHDSVDVTMLHQVREDLVLLSKSIVETTILTEIRLLLVHVERGLSRKRGVQAAAGATGEANRPLEESIQDTLRRLEGSLSCQF